MNSGYYSLDYCIKYIRKIVRDLVKSKRKDALNFVVTLGIA